MNWFDRYTGEEWVGAEKKRRESNYNRHVSKGIKRSKKRWIHG